MALDHFVSQVHLKNFYAETLSKRKMYATRKSDLKQFPCGSEDVCRIENGSTSQYLDEPRLIEELIKPVEKNYNQACQELLNGQINVDTIFVIAGFASFLQICSPISLRIQVGSLESQLEVEVELLDRIGELPKAPAELGGKSLSELIEEGKVVIETDSNFPKAIGISNFRSGILAFGNFRWEILINELNDSPFLTSDFPLTVEATRDPRLVNRVLPLTPNLAVRICPRLDLSQSEISSDTFKHFRFRRHRLSYAEVRKVNQLIVRSAEDMVFSSTNDAWVAKFVAKNRGYCVEGVYDKIPCETGFINLTRTRLRKC